jgi:hypothetical protein
MCPPLPAHGAHAAPNNISMNIPYDASQAPAQPLRRTYNFTKIDNERNIFHEKRVAAFAWD